MPKQPERNDLLRKLDLLEKENQSLRRALTANQCGQRSYPRLFDNVPVGMIEIDFARERCVAVNQFVLDGMGYARDEFLGLDMQNWVAAGSRGRFSDFCERVRGSEGGANRAEIQITTKDGRLLWHLFEVQYAPVSGESPRAWVVLTNMDTHKRILKALEESEQRFRRLVETMNEGLIILDRNGRLIYVNRHLEEISGYGAEELVGRNIQDFLPPDVARDIYRRLTRQENDAHRSFEMRWRRKSGEQRYSIVSPQALPMAESGESELFAVITDITAKKKAEQAVRQREKELQVKNAQLEEMNTALRTLVKMREKNQVDIKMAISTSMQQLVDPLIEKLRRSSLNDRQRILVDLLSDNLDEMISSDNQGFSSRFLLLTPAEIDVANMVKHGRTTKEIAAILNVSTRTVDMHRLSIRRKLGLRRQGTNLRTYLLTT